MSTDRISTLNKAFAQNKDLLHLVEEVLQEFSKPIFTTSFGYDSGVLLSVIARVAREVPVLWIDTGFTHRDTYAFIKSIVRNSGINLKVYSPTYNSNYLSNVLGIDPLGGPDSREKFNFHTKVEPMQRALAEHKPDLWVSGVRAEETDHRKNLEMFVKSGDLIKFSPLIHWSHKEVREFKSKNSIPSPGGYFDPTKTEDREECGIHLI
ncbi:phosphoadenosine phosphosulfate reductase family protein [Biformimicrobium ophioploci]|uniref:Phosphoadenosine phosphosulphate reductase domain-containing protein n=1 Tax=Biformimicrobium ophioploci TaxID=3036711 RepID=A0ABQ6M207_9GAMM|nr:phosphoadenosine phosphosulfate reductase family protein [Microbulbifer sp. NKW57]GMG88324.1 hypothetical protein MNKW57_26450 [Microbulbifer sp. NKW57]